MISIHESAKFVIQQTLHGYSDGHRLLASSCRLPKDAESLMLILSDLSGPGGGDQFDPYLTGYPLESTGRYALGCTWPAPEMGRPGCVWTHTLLLGEELLAEMNNPEEFLKLFRRPTAPSGFGDYLGGMRVPELFGSRDRRTAPLDDWTARLGPHLLRTLYGSAAPFTVLTVPRYSAADMPCLSTWRLQWPRLRARFTFCGGARAVRTVEGEPMNLQATLDRDVRRLDRGAVPPALVLSEFAPGEPAGEWVGIAAAAWSAPDANNLVGFFNRLGKGLPGDPSLFRPAAEVYAILGHSSHFDAVARELVAYVAREFPDADAGSEFKSAILGPKNVTGLPELAVLRAFAETERWGAFEPDALLIRLRSAALWQSRESAWGLMSRLLAGMNTQLSEMVLSGLIEGMPHETLIAALDTGGEVLEGFVRRCPQIAATPLYWSPPAQRQARAARGLVAAGDGASEILPEIVNAALDAGADPADPSLVDVFGDRTVPVALAWLDSDGTKPSRLPGGWQSSLRRKPSQMLGWLCGREAVREETARFILSEIDFAAVFPSRELTVALARFLPVIEAAGPENGGMIGCGALKVALSTASPRGAELAAACLDVVYRAALNSRLPDDAWWKVSSELPRCYWWQDWDRCERLRKAVAERFAEGRWPASALPAITSDEVIFDALVEELRDSKPGRRVLKEAVSSATGRRREVILKD
ncbi:MAG: hypothetical protein K2X38_22930 [Gemmataceae bacterium]|nr:hypothetical protein [Gemmataceae bacterium]